MFDQLFFEASGLGRSKHRLVSIANLPYPSPGAAYFPQSNCLLLEDGLEWFHSPFGLDVSRSIHQESSLAPSIFFYLLDFDGRLTISQNGKTDSAAVQSESHWLIPSQATVSFQPLVKREGCLICLRVGESYWRREIGKPWPATFQKILPDVYLKSLIGELDVCKPGISKLRQKTLCYQILGWLVSKVGAVSGNRSIRNVQEQLQANLNGHLPPLEALAQEANLSVSAFKTKFRKETGMSVQQYFLRAKMAKAADMLDSGLSVKETALGLGYANMSNFTHAFKRERGMTPSAHCRQKT